VTGRGGPPTDGEPAVRSPDLRRIVAGIRALPPPPSRVELGAIRRQIDARGRGFRSGVAAGVIMAAAAAVAVWIGSPPPRAAVLELDDAGPAPVASQAYAPFDELPIELSSAIRVTWTGGEPPMALGSTELALGRGSYGVTLGDPTAGPVTIRVAERRLELAQGELAVTTWSGAPVVVLRTGIAAFVDPDGTRHALTVEATRVAVRPDETGSAPGADELARAAEKKLAAGERRAAIVELRTLVQRFPRSAAARTALLDLGRELGREGMREHARCAYRLYLERWPAASLRPDVERELARLGGGACDGLDPA
jgi:hypothetical protein